MLLSLAGCTGVADDSAKTEKPIPQPSESPTSIVDVPTGTIAATGTFRGDSVAGTVEVVKVDGDYTLQIRGLERPTGPATLRFVGAEVDKRVACPTLDWGYDTGRITDDADQDFPLHQPLAPFFADPTFLSAILLTDNDIEAITADCPTPVLAVARLTWTLGDLRPDLTPRDGGEMSGATGTMTPHGDEPWSYRIASGDTYLQIAERFGLSPSDLDYLNPISDWNSRRDYLESGCTLNLSKENRGAKGTCELAP